MMILYCRTSYPWYCCFNFHLNGPYFKIFSAVFFVRLVIHGQLISRVNSLYLMVDNAGVDSVCCHLFMHCKYWDIPECLCTVRLIYWHRLHRRVPRWTDSMSPRSYTISKNKVFKVALCRVRYLIWARAVQPARTWVTLSGALSQSLHVTAPVQPVPIF